MRLAGRRLRRELAAAIAAELAAQQPQPDANIAVGIPDGMITITAADSAAATDSRASVASSATKTVIRKPAAAPVSPSAAKQKPLPPPPSPPSSSGTVAASNATAATAAAAAPTVHKVQRARGVLYGLSTLQRQGNVRVNVHAYHTTVKSHFRLGPLQLRVEKAFGRGAKRELKSATATTTEMLGRITLRIARGAATLHAIKVQQPRQLLVTSGTAATQPPAAAAGAEDRNEPARAFVWRNSAHIASVVGEQLTAAARSMLEPAPQPMDGELEAHMDADGEAEADAHAEDDADEEEQEEAATADGERATGQTRTA